MNDFHNETEQMKSPQINKDSIINWLRKQRDNVTEGIYDAKKTYLALHEIDKVFKGCFETIKEEAKFALGEETDFINGFQIKKKSGGNTYVFKGIESWDKVNTELKKIETIAKFNYNNLSKIETIVDEETGDIINKETGEIVIVPKVKAKADSIEVTKIKK